MPMFQLMGDFLQRDLKQPDAIVNRSWRLAHVYVRLLGFDIVFVNVTLGLVFGALSIVGLIAITLAAARRNTECDNDRRSID